MTRHEIAKIIHAETKPGQWYTLDRSLASRIECIPGWSLAESIMENIVGSAYEFTFSEGADAITFHRRSVPLTGDLRTYVAPDRRHFFTLRRDGLYQINLNAS